MKGNIAAFSLSRGNIVHKILLYKALDIPHLYERRYMSTSYFWLYLFWDFLIKAEKSHHSHESQSSYEIRRFRNSRGLNINRKCSRGKPGSPIITRISIYKSETSRVILIACWRRSIKNRRKTKVIALTNQVSISNRIK